MPEEKSNSSSAQLFNDSSLLVESICNGLDIDMYHSLVDDYSFFPYDEPEENYHVKHINIDSCTLHTNSPSSFRVSVLLRASTVEKTWRARALIDSGAQEIFLNQKFVIKNEVDDSAPDFCWRVFHDKGSWWRRKKCLPDWRGFARFSGAVLTK